MALVHDYLIDYGGAERVLLALHEIYPEAPIYVSVLDKKGVGIFWKEFSKAKIISSWFNNLPFSNRLISPLRFLLPLIWGSFDLSKYDLIIDSSSWAVTRGFKKNDKQIEICYCHTPPRYLYGFDTSRRWTNRWFGKLIDIYALIVNHFMRMYDFDQAQKVDFFIANSKNTAERIRKYYRRESVVIYPPCEGSPLRMSRGSGMTSRLLSGMSDNYYLTGGRIVASKNFDLIIEACKKANVNLKIFGSGVEEGNLRKLADGHIEFLGKISDEKKFLYYKNAKAFILAQRDEDFGITTVEANAVGCPVIAYKGGGYLETVIDNKTGIFFSDLTIDGLAKAIKRFERIKINPRDCVKRAKKFSKERFEKEIRRFIRDVTRDK